MPEAFHTLDARYPSVSLHSPLAMNTQPDISARPLLIGGMHRSGTSLTASLFAGAGLDIGPDLLGANPWNPLGHFEDLGFFAFHRRALVAQGLGHEGFTASARGTVPDALELEARNLLAARMRGGVAWGWKDPRTTLFLDFWQDRLPEARHVFIFRRPWEVVDSLFRRGDETFAINPTFALEVWTHYNRLIIDFVGRHPDRCLVFEISQVIADPDTMLATVRTRLGVPLRSATPTYIDRLFGHDDASVHPTIVRTLAPEAWRTYEDLCELAGSAVSAAPPSERPFADSVLLEWCRCSRATARAREAGVGIQADVESRINAEVEGRINAEFERRIHAEVESRLRAAALERRRRRSPGVAVRRATGTLLATVAATARWLSGPPAPTPADAPDLLPFPQGTERRSKRVA